MAIELKIDPDTFCRLALQELLLRPAYLAEHAGRAA
jgi:hypothetical protein